MRLAHKSRVGGPLGDGDEGRRSSSVTSSSSSSSLRHPIRVSHRLTQGHAEVKSLPAPLSTITSSSRYVRLPLGASTPGVRGAAWGGRSAPAANNPLEDDAASSVRSGSCRSEEMEQGGVSPVRRSPPYHLRRATSSLRSSGTTLSSSSSSWRRNNPYATNIVTGSQDASRLHFLSRRSSLRTSDSGNMDFLRMSTSVHESPAESPGYQPPEKAPHAVSSFDGVAVDAKWGGPTAPERLSPNMMITSQLAQSNVATSQSASPSSQSSTAVAAPLTFSTSHSTNSSMHNGKVNLALRAPPAVGTIAADSDLAMLQNQVNLLGPGAGAEPSLRHLDPAMFTTIDGLLHLGSHQLGSNGVAVSAPSSKTVPESPAQFVSPNAYLPSAGPIFVDQPPHLFNAPFYRQVPQEQLNAFAQHFGSQPPPAAHNVKVVALRSATPPQGAAFASNRPLSPSQAAAGPFGDTMLGSNVASSGSIIPGVGMGHPPDIGRAPQAFMQHPVQPFVTLQHPPQMTPALGSAAAGPYRIAPLQLHMQLPQQVGSQAAFSSVSVPLSSVPYMQFAPPNGNRVFLPSATQPPPQQQQQLQQPMPKPQQQQQLHHLQHQHQHQQLQLQFQNHHQQMPQPPPPPNAAQVPIPSQMKSGIDKPQLAAPPLSAMHTKIAPGPPAPPPLPPSLPTPQPSALVKPAGQNPASNPSVFEIPISSAELEAMMRQSPGHAEVFCPKGWTFSVYDSSISKHYAIESQNVVITAGAVKYVDFFQRFGTQTRFRFQLCKRFLTNRCASQHHCQFIHTHTVPQCTSVHINENAPMSTLSSQGLPSVATDPSMLGGRNEMFYETLPIGFTFSVFPPNNSNTEPQLIPSGYVLKTAGAINAFAVLAGIATRVVKHIRRSGQKHGISTVELSSLYDEAVVAEKHKDSGIEQLRRALNGVVDDSSAAGEGLSANLPTNEILDVIGTPMRLVPPLAPPGLKPRHCAHFQFKRMCHLGEACNFIHSLVPFIQGVTRQQQQCIFEQLAQKAFDALQR